MLRFSGVSYHSQSCIIYFFILKWWIKVTWRVFLPDSLWLVLLFLSFKEYSKQLNEMCVRKTEREKGREKGRESKDKRAKGESQMAQQTFFLCCRQNKSVDVSWRSINRKPCWCWTSKVKKKKKGNGVILMGLWEMRWTHTSSGIGHYSLDEYASSSGRSCLLGWSLQRQKVCTKCTDAIFQSLPQFPKGSIKKRNWLYLVDTGLYRCQIAQLLSFAICSLVDVVSSTEY